jgi:D-alanine-D-alanine ligase
MKILILAGGTSNERDVSLRSGANVATATQALGHEVVRADPGEADFDLAHAVADIDVVLSTLHGAGGEDGTMQRVLERYGKPFVGSGSVASALAFDKSRYKERLVTEEGINLPEGVVVNKMAFEASPLIKSPFVLKPIKGGSSLDIHIVHDVTKLPVTIDEVFARYGELLLEELIDGQEVTVGVLGDEALPLILIEPPAGEEFDYANKYNGKSRELTNPTTMSTELQRRAQELALKVHHLIGCRHLSRSDMIITPKGEIYLLETNTIPGLTEASLLPKAAAAAGITMAQLVERLLALALAG